jgi:opacity protein-like surface antigen
MWPRSSNGIESRPVLIASVLLAGLMSAAVAPTAASASVPSVTAALSVHVPFTQFGVGSQAHQVTITRAKDQYTTDDAKFALAHGVAHRFIVNFANASGQGVAYVLDNASIRSIDISGGTRPVETVVWKFGSLRTRVSTSPGEFLQSTLNEPYP